MSDNAVEQSLTVRLSVRLQGGGGGGCTTKLNSSKQQLCRVHNLVPSTLVSNVQELRSRR